MKRQWSWIAAGLLVLALLPSTGTELGQLHPAAVLYVRKDGQIRLETDTGEYGAGETLRAAQKNLEETTAGYVRLDTVETVLVTEETRYLLRNLKEILRPTVSVCLAEGEIDVEKAAAYLHSHRPENMLAESEKRKLPRLIAKEGRYTLEQ